MAEGGGSLGEALFAEFLVAVEWARFGDAVAEEHEDVAGFKSHGGFPVGGGGHDAEDDAATAEALGAAVGFDENGWIVACVTVGSGAGLGVENAGEESNEAVAGAIGGDGAVEAGDAVGEIAGLVEDDLDASLEAGHEEGGGHALAGDVGYDEGNAAIGVGDEIVVIAADSAAGGVVAGQIEASDPGSGGGEEAPLDFGGLGHFLGQEALGGFDFGEAGVFDADGGDVGHDGEEAEILLGEFVNEVGTVEIDEANDTVVGLEGDGQHAADLLFDDAHAFLEHFVEPGIADEEGIFLSQDTLANGGADEEALAAGGANDQLLAFESHEDAAGGADGVDGKIHDQGEEFGEGAVAGELAAGADEGVDLRTGFEARGVFRVVLEDAGETGDDGAIAARGGFLGFDEEDGVGGGGGGAELDDEVAGGDAVAGAEEMGGVDALAVDEGAVLAAEVADDPGIAGGFEGEVLAG